MINCVERGIPKQHIHTYLLLKIYELYERLALNHRKPFILL